MDSKALATVGASISQKFDLALAEALLTGVDGVLVVLAAAHGLAKRAGLRNDELVRAAAEVWDACEARAPRSRSLDVDFAPSGKISVGGGR